VHASTVEGHATLHRRRVDTIEHGYGGHARNLPRHAGQGHCVVPDAGRAGDAIARYRGWDGKAPLPAALELERRRSRRHAPPGSSSCAGGDVGVFAHGDNRA
jgi:hypothetical protein